ncbi:amyloid-like protein 1 isoform X2 [Tachyglossus aculeatus]|uniref:amyloid-like protein 1 isoform X2 n=1 Tax=Tachyglossus aculeatus TaxID=9261 RepID=UPI0018F57FF9|nr:amyloid-like protein 1 isoform X2 [Tachyglossus aculeatus]
MGRRTGPGAGLKARPGVRGHPRRSRSRRSRGGAEPKLQDPGTGPGPKPRPRPGPGPGPGSARRSHSSTMGLAPAAAPTLRRRRRRLGLLLPFPLPPLLLLLLPPGPGSRAPAGATATSAAGEVVGDPQVALGCGTLSLHRDLRTGRWQPDPQRSHGCFRGPHQVLAYCQQMYPELRVGRVEAAEPIPMARWCRGAPGERCPHHVIVPYRCLPGEFVSDALLVPEHCRFGHQERMAECESAAHRQRQAQEACRAEGFELRDSGMLLPCGPGRFRGVEYVCCPPSGPPPPTAPQEAGPSETPTLAPTPGREREREEEKEEDEEGEEFPVPVDDYFVEPPGAEEEEEEEEEEEGGRRPSTHPPSGVSKVTPTPRPTDGVDVYFEAPGAGGEHAGFLQAKTDLEERRMRQINEVMKEWAEADHQAKSLPKADRQALNEHFQSILQTLEEQVSGERQRLVETHLARVAALLNDHRRATLEAFLAALQEPQPQAERVLQALRRYLRAERKDQRHTLRHYQHVAAVDAEKAEQMRFQVQTHLRVIEERMNQSLGLLYQDRHLAQRLHPHVQELLRSEGLGPGALPSVEELTPSGGSSEDGGSRLPEIEDGLTAGEGGEGAPPEGEVTSVELQVNVSLGAVRGVAFRSPEIQRDELEPGPGGGLARGALAGLLVVAVAVGGVVLSLLLVRRRRPYGAISHGVVEVDPILNLEEPKPSSLQPHGYENPTYRCLEERG